MHFKFSGHHLKFPASGLVAMYSHYSEFNDVLSESGQHASEVLIRLPSYPFPVCLYSIHSSPVEMLDQKNV